MTVLFMTCCLAMTTLFATFASDLAGVASLRARAQVAADGAALAAAVEGTIAGSGEPVAVARYYAEQNGGRLASCECEVGASSVRVRVEIAGIAAEAKAAVDPAGLGPAAGAGSARLAPALAVAVDELVSESHGAVRLGSGFRDHAEQEVLWRAALERYGDPEVADDWVARPGSSFHEKGLAVDLAGDVELAARLVSRLGLPLHRPLPWEPWHFELLGSRG
jgi:hypothetical protein